MKKIVYFLLITFSVISSNAQESIKWLSFEDAITLNKTNPKPILIDIYTDWCGYCKKMDLKTYANKTIIEAINKHFYAVKLNGEEKKDIVYKEHTFKYQKNGRSGYHQLAAVLMDGKISYPTTIFLSETEEKNESIPGYLEKEMFEKILKYFSSKANKNMTWADFEKDFKSKL